MFKNWETATIEVIRDFFLEKKIKHSNYRDTGEWLSKFFNWQLRAIPEQHWQLRVSKEISRQLCQHPSRDTCLELFHDAAIGSDLNPYQSRGLLNADVNDGLYNDWGIHHLHLSRKKSKVQDYFYDRSDYLMLVKFTSDTAYFVDVYEHKKESIWSTTDLIRIVQRNWPSLLVRGEIYGKQFYPDVNGEEIGALRKKGYLFGINVDHKSHLMVNHGYLSDRHNMQANLMADELIRWVGKYTHINESEIEFKTKLKKQLGLTVNIF